MRFEKITPHTKNRNLRNSKKIRKIRNPTFENLKATQEIGRNQPFWGLCKKLERLTLADFPNFLIFSNFLNIPSFPVFRGWGNFPAKNPRMAKKVML